VRGRIKGKFGLVQRGNEISSIFVTKKFQSRWKSLEIRGFTDFSFYSSAPESPADKDEDAGADEAGDEITEPTLQNDSKYRKDSVGDDRADDSKKDVHENTHIAFHELFGEPPGDTTDDDGCDPANASRFHDFLPCCCIIKGDDSRGEKQGKLLKTSLYAGGFPRGRR
jgi:hypothetical protein